MEWYQHVVLRSTRSVVKESGKLGSYSVQKLDQYLAYVDMCCAGTRCTNGEAGEDDNAGRLPKRSLRPGTSKAGI